MLDTSYGPDSGPDRLRSWLAGSIPRCASSPGDSREISDRGPTWPVAYAVGDLGRIGSASPGQQPVTAAGFPLDTDRDPGPVVLTRPVRAGRATQPSMEFPTIHVLSIPRASSTRTAWREQSPAKTTPGGTSGSGSGRLSSTRNPPWLTASPRSSLNQRLTRMVKPSLSPTARSRSRFPDRMVSSHSWSTPRSSVARDSCAFTCSSSSASRAMARMAFSSAFLSTALTPDDQGTVTNHRCAVDFDGAAAHRYIEVGGSFAVCESVGAGRPPRVRQQTPAHMAGGPDLVVVPCLEIVVEHMGVGARAGDLRDVALLHLDGHRILHIALPRDQCVARLEDDSPFGRAAVGKAGHETGWPVVPSPRLVDIAPLMSDGQVGAGDIGDQFGTGRTGHPKGASGT